MSEDPKAVEDMDRVKAACRLLGERFDCVQIFVSRHEAFERETINASYGEGNWYARFGQVAEWMERQNERTRKSIREEE